MRNTFNTNAPYFILGALSTFTLLTSGVLAVAPYASFLAPVAVLSASWGLPFIIVCAVFSVVTFALSYSVISKNKTIADKEAVLTIKNQGITRLHIEISSKDNTILEQGAEISSLKDLVAQRDTTISSLMAEKKAEISKIETELTDKCKLIEILDAQAIERKTEIDTLKDQLAKQKKEVRQKKYDNLCAKRQQEEADALKEDPHSVVNLKDNELPYLETKNAEEPNNKDKEKSQGWGEFFIDKARATAAFGLASASFVSTTLQNTIVTPAGGMGYIAPFLS